VNWSLHVEVQELAVHPNLPWFAVRTTSDSGSELLVYDALCAELLYTFDVGATRYCGMMFLSTHHGANEPLELIALTNQQEFHIFRSSKSTVERVTLFVHFFLPTLAHTVQ
jgi:hypothetical protein